MPFLTFFLPQASQFLTNFQQGVLESGTALLVLGLFYLMVTVSTTMFSSREDLKGIVGFLIAVGVIIAVLVIIGLRIHISAIDLPPIVLTVFLSFTQSIGLVLIFNLILLVVMSILVQTLEKIFRVKVI